jgi:hypothetical protein
MGKLLGRRVFASAFSVYLDLEAKALDKEQLAADATTTYYYYYYYYL